LEAFEVPFTDKTLTCVDCGTQFIFTADDQEFYSQRGFTEPKRCRNCRSARRTDRDGGDMGGGGGFNRAPRPERELFDVVCSNCGQPTKVPFQPRGDRPVYCRDCFDKMGGGSRAGGGGGSRSYGGGGGGGGYGGGGGGRGGYGR
jgi:CxxC-x17-CxxC domain-containing protein